MTDPTSITLISGTDRKNSHTRIIAEHLHQHLSSIGVKSQLLDLEQIPVELLKNPTYSAENRNKGLSEIQDDFFVHCNKFIFVVPEYNGSFPGVLKLFLDSLSVRKYEETFFHKKACLIGVASGRAGNLRGLDHLSDILNYLGVIVFPSKLPVSRVFEFVDGGEVVSQEVRRSLEGLVDDFIQF